MNSTQTFIVIVAVIFLIGIIVYLLRNRITKLNLSIFKDLITFGGEASSHPEPKNNIAIPVIENTPFQDQFMSHKVLHILQAKLQKTQGHHAILETTTENFHAASTLYGQLYGDIIGTCFFENPDYGEHDLAEAILPNSRFTRITTRGMCSDSQQTIINDRFQKYRSRCRLVVLEKETEISKIGGIFCKCDDGSHLAFMALNNYCDAKPKNLGLVYCGDLAEQMYRYYKSFVDRYE